MNIYDTLIIGCGYSSLGYAAANKKSIICEEHQVCDTSFYLPLRSFQYRPYHPRTKEGSRLWELFDSLSLFRNNQQNTHGFECAICKYIVERKLQVLLKCRVIQTQKRSDGIYDVTVQTNEGLTHLFARKILDTINTSAEKNYTVLFMTDDIKKASRQLTEAFYNPRIEPAFYPGRYALHIAAESMDEHSIKLAVYEKWKSLAIDAKILYMAPVFGREQCPDIFCDENYDNPIEAFEAGYDCAAEVTK